MQPDPYFWADKPVCVTGGTGYLGWHLVGQLADLGARVRIFGLRPLSKVLQEKLSSHDCVFGDVRDADLAHSALRDRAIVFHTAGSVATWGPALKQMHEIHTLGTERILHALPANARLIHTSSVVAVGASRGGEILTEDAPFNLHDLKVDYVHAKRAAEEIALAAAARGLDVVVVNPGYLIGPEEYDGSIMGQFCVRFWRGKVPLVPPGRLNFVDVRDVARGHILAAEHGTAGRRYILGGENLTMRQFAEIMARTRGMSPRFGMPRWLEWTLALLAESRGWLLKREPQPCFQHVRMSRYAWYYSSERARTELGYEPRPVADSLRDAHDWLERHDWFKPVRER